MDWSSFRLGNAAGFIKGPGDTFDQMLRSAATDITIGSITLEERPGNTGTTYHLLEGGTSINALGLPNPGLGSLWKKFGDMAERAGVSSKRLRFSVAGFNPEEYAMLAEPCREFGDVELNLGCPNVWGKGGQKPIPAFDLKLMEEILRTVSFRTEDFDVKVSPYSDPRMIPEVAGILRLFPVRNVVTCNTFPNGCAFGEEGRRLQTPSGYGGVGGNALYAIALGQVSQFAEALSGTGIGIIGAGGVDSGERFQAMRAAGATAVQVGTAFGEQGARIFSDITEQAVSSD